jgi:hypothetical protein
VPFVNMERLIIYFGKTESLMTNEENLKIEIYAKVFNCLMGSCPIKY